MFSFHVDSFRPWKGPAPTNTSTSTSQSPKRSPVPAAVNTIPATDSRPFSHCREKGLPIPPNQPSKHPLPARPPAEVCAHANMRSSTIPYSHFQRLSSPQPAFKVEDTVQPTSTELHVSSPTSLHPSAATDRSKGDSESQPEIRADILFRDGILAGDTHNGCMGVYDKGSKTLDAPNTL